MIARSKIKTAFAALSGAFVIGLLAPASQAEAGYRSYGWHAPVRHVVVHRHVYRPVVTRVVYFGYDVQRAVEAPRWLYGRTWGDPTAALRLEASLPRETLEALPRMGHDVRIVPAWSDALGHAQAIRIDREHGVLWAAADPRSDGAAAGW